MTCTGTRPVDLIVSGLHRAGVRRLFGMPGGGPNLDLIGAADDARIRFTLAHSESAACVMAGAYGLLTQTAGATVVTRGPGLTNAISGLAQATLDQAPLLLLSDLVPAQTRQRIAHQRVDQISLSRPVTRWSGTVGNTRVEEVAAAAARLAVGPPAGAVHLDVDPGVAGDPPPGEPDGVPVDGAGSARARRIAQGARRPVVIVGLDAVPYLDALRPLLATAGCPVLTTYQAKGAVPDEWPVAAGLFTNSELERPLLAEADLVIAVGVDPVEPMPADWSYSAPVLMLQPVPRDPGYFGAPTVVTGPPAGPLAELFETCRPGWTADAGQAHRAGGLRALDAAPGGGLRPDELVRLTQRLSPAGCPVTVDAGAHMLVAMPYWRCTRPHEVLISNGLSTMGYALPAAIGAALATPGQRVVCLVGDGGLGMTLAELETLARLRLPVTVVVFNDALLSLIELKQGPDQGDESAVRFGQTDFAAVAAGMGVPAAVADRPEAARAALDGLDAASGPFLLDARIDPSGYPHVLAVSRG